MVLPRRLGWLSMESEARKAQMNGKNLSFPGRGVAQHSFSARRLCSPSLLHIHTDNAKSAQKGEEMEGRRNSSSEGSKLAYLPDSPRCPSRLPFVYSQDASSYRERGGEERGTTGLRAHHSLLALKIRSRAQLLRL